MFDDILTKTFYGNTIANWAIALIIILGSFLVAKAVMWIIGNFVKKLTQKTETRLDDILVDKAEEPIVFAGTIIGIWIGIKTLTMPETATLWLGRAYFLLIIFNIAWLIARIIDALIEEYLVPIVEKSESTFDDQLLPILKKGIKATIWVIAIIVGLNNAGYDVGALLAGLGIGGLAFALAAQDTVSNLFGGFTIFTDQPFQINDRVKVKGYDGNVKEIGIRSTQIQTLEGRTVTIPNSQFTSNPIENVSSEPNRKVVLTLGLTYDTNAAQIEEAINILKQIIADNQDKVEDKVLTGFNNFGNFSLDVLFIYYITKGSDILETQTCINLEILKRFTAVGLDFAFPTQTILNKQLN